MELNKYDTNDNDNNDSFRMNTTPQVDKFDV